MARETTLTEGVGATLSMRDEGLLCHKDKEKTQTESVAVILHFPDLYPLYEQTQFNAADMTSFTM